MGAIGQVITGQRKEIKNKKVQLMPKGCVKLKSVCANNL